MEFLVKMQMNLGLLLRKLIYLIAQCSPSNSTKRSSFQRSSSIAVLFNSRPEKKVSKKVNLVQSGRGCFNTAHWWVLSILFRSFTMRFLRFSFAKFLSRIQLNIVSHYNQLVQVNKIRSVLYNACIIKNVPGSRPVMNPESTAWRRGPLQIGTFLMVQSLSLSVLVDNM